MRIQPDLGRQALSECHRDLACDPSSRPSDARASTSHLSRRPLYPRKYRSWLCYTAASLLPSRFGLYGLGSGPRADTRHFTSYYVIQHRKTVFLGLFIKMSLQCSPNPTLSPGAQHIPNADTNLNGCRNAAPPPAPADARGWTQILVRYREPSHVRSIIEIAITFGPLAALSGSGLDGILFWILVDFSADHSAGRGLSGSACS